MSEDVAVTLKHLRAGAAVRPPAKYLNCCLVAFGTRQTAGQKLPDCLRHAPAASKASV